MMELAQILYKLGRKQKRRWGWDILASSNEWKEHRMMMRGDNEEVQAGGVFTGTE